MSRGGAGAGWRAGLLVAVALLGAACDDESATLVVVDDLSSDDDGSSIAGGPCWRGNDLDSVEQAACDAEDGGSAP